MNAFRQDGALTRFAHRLRRRAARRRRLAPGCDSVLPIGPGYFRLIVRALITQRAAELERRHGRPFNFTAQDGEDLLLATLFSFKRAGSYVEIGAYDGLTLSNSYFFEQWGWSGLLVEPLPEHAAACRHNRPGSTVVHAAIGRDASGTTTLHEVVGDRAAAAHSYVVAPDAMVDKAARQADEVRTHEVPFRTFEAVAAEAGLPPDQPIDFISVDCEGMDLSVVQSIDLARRRPRILIVEYVRPPLVAHLRDHGYEAMLHIRANTLFSREPTDRAHLSIDGYWAALTGSEVT